MLGNNWLTKACYISYHISVRILHQLSYVCTYIYHIFVYIYIYNNWLHKLPTLKKSHGDITQNVTNVTPTNINKNITGRRFHCPTLIRCLDYVIDQHFLLRNEWHQVCLLYSRLLHLKCKHIIMLFYFTLVPITCLLSAAYCICLRCLLNFLDVFSILCSLLQFSSVKPRKVATHLYKLLV